MKRGFFVKENKAVQKTTGFIKEFKDFISKGNVIDLAVGVIIGGAFSGIVTNLVTNIITPAISLLTGKISFTDLFKDSSVILQNNTSIKNIQEGMADDLATLVYNLAGILDNKMEFNQIYRENFRNLDNINLINGNFEMGFVESNNILEFQMNEIKTL